MIKRQSQALEPYLILFPAVLFVYFIIYTSAEFEMTDGNLFNSYSLQAYRWLQGHLDLAYNYHHLEIAIFNNRYYISFPPVPSIVMLPFVAFLGSPETPDHVIALVVSLLALVYAYKIAETQIENKAYAVFFTLFLFLGTNYLQIALRGIVWHIAQNLAFLFLLMALYYALTPKRWHSYLSLFLLCCAMGSRPLQVIYTPLIVYLLYQREGAPIPVFFKKLLLYGLPALLLGTGLLWLNYARFGSIFEFGHNYLPASLYAPYGQFSVMYMPHHLRLMFSRLPTQWPVFGAPEVLFQPIAFWIASPIVLSYVVYWIMGIKNRERYDAQFQHVYLATQFKQVYLLLIPALLFLHLLLLSAHKDVGGPQLGYRYTIDVLVVLFFGLTALFGKMEQTWNGGNSAHMTRNLPLFLAGFLINLFGTINAMVS